MDIKRLAVKDRRGYKICQPLQPERVLKSERSMTYENEVRMLLFRLGEPPDELVSGEAAIAKLAGFKNARYFAEKYMAQVEKRELPEDGVISQHTPTGHCYFYKGEVHTLTNSAQAWGNNARAQTVEKRRRNVPGWFGPANERALGNAAGARLIDDKSISSQSYCLVGELPLLGPRDGEQN